MPPYNQQPCKPAHIPTDSNAIQWVVIRWCFSNKIISLLGTLGSLTRKLSFILSIKLLIGSTRLVILGMLILIPLLLPTLGIGFLRDGVLLILSSMSHPIFIRLISLRKLLVRGLVGPVSYVCSMGICYHQLIFLPCHSVIWLILCHHNLGTPTWQHTQPAKCNRKTMISTLQPAVRLVQTQMWLYVSTQHHTIIITS